MKALRCRHLLRPWALAGIVLTSAVVSGQSASHRLALPFHPVSRQAYDWPEFDEPDWSGAHQGADLMESQIGASNVSLLSRVFSASLPSIADGAPVEVHNVKTPTGSRDLVIVTTLDGHTIALDAHTGAGVWSADFGPSTCRVNRVGPPCFTTSSPAVGPARKFVYAYGLDGQIHKLAVATGGEVTTGGWPERITLKDFDEKESPAISIAATPRGNFLYAANGGYPGYGTSPGDAGDYQGHVTTINLTSGAQVVFNTLCSSQTVHFVEAPGTPDCSHDRAAVWSRPGVVFDAHTRGGAGSIFFATGNGDFDPAAGDWGDSVLSLNADGTGAGGGPIDSYTPSNFQSLDDDDLDLGSTAPTIIPPAAVPPWSKYRDIGVQGGKDAVLRLINLDNLNGSGVAGPVGGELSQVRVDYEVKGQPAVWVNPSDGVVWLFVNVGNAISGFTLSVGSAGIPHLEPRWSEFFPIEPALGSSPLVANGVLFDARNNVIEARNPTDGGLLWKSHIGPIHWESPVVANGVLYIADGNGMLNAFALPVPEVSRFRAVRSGNRILFTWRAMNTGNVAGFDVVSQGFLVNPRLIPSKQSVSYSFAANWPRPSYFSLVAVLRSGETQLLASLTAKQ